MYTDREGKMKNGYIARRNDRREEGAEKYRTSLQQIKYKIIGGNKKKKA